MAQRRASELIMVITAMNHALIMARRRASELIMAVTAMTNICLPNPEACLPISYTQYTYIYI